MKKTILILIIFLSCSQMFSQTQYFKKENLTNFVISASTNILVYSITKDKKKAFYWGVGISSLYVIIDQLIKLNYTSWLNQSFVERNMSSIIGSIGASLTITVFEGNAESRNKRKIKKINKRLKRKLKRTKYFAY